MKWMEIEKYAWKTRKNEDYAGNWGELTCLKID